MAVTGLGGRAWRIGREEEEEAWAAAAAAAASVADAEAAAAAVAAAVASWSRLAATPGEAERGEVGRGAICRLYVVAGAERVVIRSSSESEAAEDAEDDMIAKEPGLG